LARIQLYGSPVLTRSSLPYHVTKIEFSKNTQKEPWFLDINPNGRIPAITDKFEDGKPIRIFESGSIMLYLVAKYDKDHKISFPPGSREFIEVLLCPLPFLRSRSDGDIDEQLAFLHECWSWSHAGPSQPLYQSKWQTRQYASPSLTTRRSTHQNKSNTASTATKTRPDVSTASWTSTLATARPTIW